ncbi:hypothetical protein JXQ70_16165 [bacterium]|nr:hypothetical protein [bacterium]
MKRSLVLYLFLINTVLVLCLAQLGQAGTPTFFEIKGTQLYYSLDGNTVLSESDVTVVYGLIACAANGCALDLSDHRLKLSGNVVMVGPSGTIVRGQSLLLDCLRLEGQLMGETIQAVRLDQNSITISPVSETTLSLSDSFKDLVELKATNIYLRTARIVYFPDRLIRTWHSTLFFEQSEAGPVPYLSRKIGRLPSPGSFGLRYLGLRSNTGLDLGLGYHYYLTDHHYGSLGLGVRRLNWWDAQHEARGELDLEHYLQISRTQYGFRASILTDDQVQFILSGEHAFRAGAVLLSQLSYQNMVRDQSPHRLEAANSLFWDDRRSSLRCHATTNLEHEWHTSLNYHEQILDNMFGELSFNYYANKAQDSGENSSRSQGTINLDWKPRFLFTGFRYSREYFHHDPFSSDEAVLTLSSQPYHSPDNLLYFSIQNALSFKRIDRELTRELMSDTVSAILETDPIAMSTHNSINFEYALTHRWEQDLPQETYFDVGAVYNLAPFPFLDTGFRYTFLTKRDATSPWFISGYQTQIGSCYLSVHPNQKIMAALNFDYDLTNDQALGSSLRSVLMLSPLYRTEILLEYSDQYQDWVRADLLICRDLHFAELRLIWRQVSESFYFEYVSRL